MKKTLLAILTTVLVSSCALDKQSLNYIKARNHGTKILKEYYEGEDYYVISRSANIIKKYHFIRVAAAGLKVTELYAVDLNTQTCYAGKFGETVIPSSKVKRDKDLRPYITW